MATITARGQYWRARIRKGGLDLNRTFDSLLEAEAWVAAEEASIDAGQRQAPSSDLTVADLFDRYAREISPSRSDPEAEVRRLRALSRMFGGKVADLDAGKIAEWRDKRLREVGAASVNRDIGLLGAVFKRAKMEWRLPIESNPAHQIIRPPNPPHRERRVTDDELDTVVRQLGWDETAAPDLLTEWVAWCARFALQTAMRRSEILFMIWKNVFDRHVHLPKTKNGDKRDVPLSSQARALFGLLHRGQGRIIPLKPGTFETYWIRAVRATGIEDLHFHDLRHEATTRMAPKFRDAMELSRVTGHRSLQALNGYFHPSVESLADKLD